MKAIFLAAPAALALALAACSGATDSQNANRAASNPTDQEAIYSGSGTVSAIAGDQVSIAHGPHPGVGWPAMTMTFTAPSDMARTVKVGDAVDFAFKKAGGAYALTSLTKR